MALFAAEYPGVPQYCFCTTPRAFTLGPVTALPWLEGLRLLAEL